MDKEGVVHIYNGIPLVIKKNEPMPFAAAWMDLEIIIFSEVSHKEKDKYHMILLINGIQNMTQMNLSMKHKRTCEEQTCGGGVEGFYKECGISRCKLLYTEQINNKVMLYRTGNHIKYSIISLKW